jgi:two-component system chemotaxis response regulator CheY
MKILIAEDNKISRELLKGMIESGGRHTVTLTNDGEEAWKLLSSPDPVFDVCIFDIYMPKMSGLELIAKVRSDERLKNVAVVLCSSADDRATIQRAVALGVTRYIVKPYAKSLVLEKLDQIAAEFEASRMIEDPRAVCERMGIGLELYRSLLGALADEVLNWCQDLRAAKNAADSQGLFIRGEGIRGSCLNLGALRASAIMGDIEARLQEFQAANPGPGAPFAFAALAALVDDLERGARMVAARPRGTS